jgi:CRP-like cAMP-binding protein
VDGGLNQLRRNRLLASLAAAELARLAEDLELVDLPTEQVLYEPGAPIPFMYFPVSAVASIVALVDERELIEVATVGREGLVGLPAYLGNGRPTERAVAQVPGRAWRVPTDRLLAHTGPEGSSLSDVLKAYTLTFLGQVARNVACNRAHTIRQRCARWLLMTEDRVDSSEFLLKQEFLAQMLGVRRASVSQAAGALAGDNGIRYRRGVITITDRDVLEQSSCSCYAVVRELFSRPLVPVA